jgi:DNA-binding GntR family transcriptional regulator
MSAYDVWLDGDHLDQIDRDEAAQDFMAMTEIQLFADDDIYAEGLGDACMDPRTCKQIVALFRKNDLLAAAQLMKAHVHTYVAERAEVATEKEFM